MKDQMIVQNFINTFHFIHWINQPTLSETIPFDNTAFMTAKQIWIENIKDTSQQAVQLKNKAQQLMRVLQYDFDEPVSQYEIKSKNNQTSIYKYKNKFIKQVSPLNKYKEQSAASVSIDVITRSTKEKNIKKRTQIEHKLMQDQQYKQEQTDKQINISKQRLKIQSKQIQIELKSKDDRKQKQTNGIGRPNFRDENIDHSNNNQILKQFCTQKPNFYQTNTQMEEYQNNFYNKGSPMQKQPIYFETGNKYSPEFPNKLKSKPITKIVQLNKMQYKKQVPYLSKINKVYINQSMEANPTIIQSANTKLKDKAQCTHINQCCHSCDRNCSNTNMDKIKNKQFNGQDNSRECQRTRNRIKSINLKSNYNKKQERNHSYYDQDINYDHENKDYFANNKLGRGRTYTQSIQSDPNSIISEHKHFIKTPACRKINKISRVQFSKTQNMSSDNYGSITHPQYLNSQPQIQTQDAKCHNKTYQYPYRNFNEVKNRQSQKQKALLFQDDLDLNDHDFMQQQIIREKMEALQQQHMKEEQEKIQYGRKQLMEKEERKRLLEMERIRKINEERQRNKKLQQKQRIENERQQRQQKKRQNNLLHKLREQFSSIGQQEHNEEEKKVSDEIKQLEVKLNEIISNNHKSRRNYQDYSPSAKVVKLNLTPSRSNIQRNNAMNCNKTQTPRASTNKSNTLLTKKISCLNSRVI